MKYTDGPQQAKGAIELIEEAVHLLRKLPATALATYCLGSFPFILGLLYFWTDMGQSPFASQHLPETALGLAALFLWLKFWQALFANHLRALILDQPPPRLSFSRCRAVFISQAALQPTGLFILPLALLPILPFAWAYAFYQNLTVLAAGESGDLASLFKKSLRLAAQKPRQNFVLLAILTGLGFFVFLNWTSVCFILPRLAKTAFGIESVFTRSGFSLLNSTFFMVMLSLSYLCVDPISKAVYALRCFYGQSMTSGEDLKAELRQFNSHALARTVSFVQAIFFPAILSGLLLGTSTQVVQAQADDPRSGTKSASLTQPTPETRGRVAPPELNRAIRQVIQQRKYSWRAPREKITDDSNAQKGMIARFLDSVQELVRQWLRSALDWLRKIFQRTRSGESQSSGYGWIMSLKILLYFLVGAVVIALLVLLIHVWETRRRRATPKASQSLQTAPDLLDEHVDANQLPEDGWTKLARELWEKGELRLAVRAFYLGSLAHLAARNLIALAKFKSNHDYERELRRRGHSFPGLLALFAETVSAFDCVWYGLHEINSELVSQFAANVERIRSGT